MGQYKIYFSNQQFMKICTLKSIYIILKSDPRAWIYTEFRVGKNSFLNNKYTKDD